MYFKAATAAHIESHPWETTTCHAVMLVTLSTGRTWVKPYAILFCQHGQLMRVMNNRKQHIELFLGHTRPKASQPWPHDCFALIQV